MVRLKIKRGSEDPLSGFAIKTCTQARSVSRPVPLCTVGVVPDVIYRVIIFQVRFHCSQVSVCIIDVVPHAIYGTVIIEV